MQEEDRRLFARISARLSLRFLNQSTGKEGQGQTINFSANGVCFATDQPLGPYTPVDIWLDIPDNHEPLHLYGKVAWVQDMDCGDKKKYVGVYLEMDKDELMGLGRILMM